MNTIKRFMLCIFAVLTVICAFGCSKNEQISSLGNDNKNGWVGETVIIGSGKTLFDLEVADDKGNINKYKVATDKKTVGEALIELKFIEVKKHEKGVLITKVDGIEADEKEKEYWSFYVDGELAPKSVSMTEIDKYSVYSFKFTK